MKPRPLNPSPKPKTQVWMRAAFKADFWKLHRVIEQDLKKGVYRLEVKGSGFRVQGSGFRV